MAHVSKQRQSKTRHTTNTAVVITHFWMLTFSVCGPSVWNQGPNLKSL